MDIKEIIKYGKIEICFQIIKIAFAIFFSIMAYLIWKKL